MRSTNLFERAQKVIPGGVNSPVRAFKSVGGKPPFIARAWGCKVWDVDENEYIDYVGSWGPMILGHAHPRVIEAIQRAAANGTSYGANCEIEVRMAELITQLVPSIEMVRMVNSGTEATMSAIRLARAYTGRDKIIKFAGCYHGHGDSFLIKAGSGAMTLGVPSTPGVTPRTASDTLNARYNDLQSVRELVNSYKNQVAAIIVEPVAGNMGVILPQDGFLQGLRGIADQEGIVLIFDEVITGFRLGMGGAQAYFDVQPDLTTLGKIIGGGLPVGAYGGKKAIMEMLAPQGPVYQAGTLSGNPLALTAGYETLQILQEQDVYPQLRQKAEFLFNGLKENFKSVGLNFTVNWIESMGCLFFTTGPVTNYDEALGADTQLFAHYHAAMLKQGIYLAPSQFEATFVSLAHTQEDLEKTLEIHKKVIVSQFETGF
ncbi:glutamate-1-semialdehyde-2,1-aminomutase [candidate division KSB1 bacterium]|nr:MAG: glutamate-1-semialdehyde-2,1-aminomutase [candidate division KSB1 bacterium]